MRAFQFLALLFLLFGLMTPLFAEPQAEHRGLDRRGRVTFYEHSYFRGGSITLNLGEGIENLTRWDFSNGVNANDRISSIRVEGQAEVVLYRDAGFRGTPLVLHADEGDLARIRREGDGPRWNDIISSIRVQEGGRQPDRSGHRDARELREVNRMIQRVYREMLQREPDASGLALYRDKVIDDNWTERQVRDNLRRSNEYREVVNRVVEKAYRELLGREIDPSGRKTYTEAMLRKGWTEEDVRNILRKSEEFKNRRK